MCDYYRGSEATGVCSMLLEKDISSQCQYDVLELYLCVNNVISHDFEECYVRVEKRSFFLRVDFSPFFALVPFKFAPVARIYHLIVSSYCTAFTVAPIVLLYVHCIVQLTTSGRL